MQNKFDGIEAYIYGGVDDVSFLAIIFNFCLVLLMSFSLKYVYKNYSYSLTGKEHIAPVLPILSAIIFLVIVVVKSSLALSLGLVGALSIVRFRTPIKEPEELVYLFLAIAIGLGYGAGYSLVTSTLGILILIIFFFTSKLKRGRNIPSEYNLVIKWNEDSLSVNDVAEVIANLSQSLKLIRLDANDRMKSAVFSANLINPSSIDALIENLKDIDPLTEVSFYQTNTNW